MMVLWLLKEVLDNSIDEYMMGYGKSIEVTVEEEPLSYEIMDAECHWER